MKYKDVYKFPLYNHWGKVYTEDDKMAFDFEGVWYNTNSEKHQNMIVDTLNGDGEYVVKEELLYKNGMIFLDGKQVITIRGWGNLTSPTCLGLPLHKAMKIQDEFANFIIKSLKG